MLEKKLTQIIYSKPHITALWILSFFIFGIMGHSIDKTYNLMLLITPYVLLFFGILVLLPEILYNRRLLCWTVSAYLMTFIIESTGVATGLIFGNYSYSRILGPVFLDVPILIGFNWIIVVLGIIIILKKYIKSNISIIISTAIFCTFFDYIMEPAAVHMNYWHWENNIIPLKNYLAWFTTAAICASLFSFLKIKTDLKLPGYYFLIQTVFFISLNTVFFLSEVK